MPLNSKNIYSLRYVIQTFYPATYFLIFYELTIKNKPVCDDKLEMEKRGAWNQRGAPYSA